MTSTVPFCEHLLFARQFIFIFLIKLQKSPYIVGGFCFLHI